MLEHDDRPAALAGFIPSKDRFLQIAGRKGVMVSNGYHDYRRRRHARRPRRRRPAPPHDPPPDCSGSGWKVVIMNEADRMTPQAEVMWLDGLERLPSKTVVIFTTNNLHKLTDRFVRRCEVQRFDATSDDFRDGMVDVVRQVWKQETGRDLDTIPQDLGKFELGSDEYSIALALQQIAPYLRTGDPLPASFTVPIVRQEPKPKLVASYGSTKVAEFAARGNGKRKQG